MANSGYGYRTWPKSQAGEGGAVWPLVWPNKPIINTFFIPFVEKCRSLHTNGITFTGPDGTQKTLKVHVLVSSCDAPARADCRNATFFNGRYGCDFCVHPGEVVEKGRGYVRVYPYSEPTPQLRSATTHVEHVQQTLDGGGPVMGIKGPSVIGLLPGFDIVKGFVPDYMHCVLLGVTRHFVCDLWLDTSNNGRQFYLGPQIETINERLQVQTLQAFSAWLL